MLHFERPSRSERVQERLTWKHECWCLDVMRIEVSQDLMLAAMLGRFSKHCTDKLNSSVLVQLLLGATRP